jgi:hypothetical protein
MSNVGTEDPQRGDEGVEQSPPFDRTAQLVAFTRV